MTIALAGWSFGEFSGSILLFCLFPEKALSFHDNSPVILQHSPATPILNENHVAQEVYYYNRSFGFNRIISGATMSSPFVAAKCIDLK